MSNIQDFYFADPADKDRSLRFSVPLDGKRISIGPFPFRPRSIVLVNQTTQNLIVEDDRGEQYIAAQSIGATYGMGDTVRMQAWLDKAPVPLQGKATVIVSEQPAGISAAQLSSFAAISGGTGVGLPAGAVSAYGGVSAPTGFVLCDGAHYNGTDPTFLNLWNAIGNNFGGASQSDFAVPDLRGRVVVGIGTNVAVDVLGENDGVAVANRRPQHRHTPHSHTITGYQFGGPNSTADAASASPVANPTSSNDGGSGNVNDPLDAPAFLVLNYIISLG